MGLFIIKCAAANANANLYGRLKSISIQSVTVIVQNISDQGYSCMCVCARMCVLASTAPRNTDSNQHYS